ncbi:TlpA_like_family domain containing protein [Acidimicrobiia bacterium]
MSNRPNRSKSASAKVRQAANGDKSKSTTLLWAGLAVVIIVIGVVVIGVSRSSSNSSGNGGVASPSGGTVVPNGDLTIGQIEVVGANLPAKPEAGTDPAIGMTIPQVTGQSFDGKTDVITPEGKPMVIIALAHWCSFCQKEVPVIQDWLDQNGMPADVELVSLATSNDPAKSNYPAGDWLRKEQWSVPTILDNKETAGARAYGVGGFPFFVVVSPEGKVLYRTSGVLSVPQWEGVLEVARTGISPIS